MKLPKNSTFHTGFLLKNRCYMIVFTPVYLKKRCDMYTDYTYFFLKKVGKVLFTPDKKQVSFVKLTTPVDITLVKNRS